MAIKFYFDYFSLNSFHFSSRAYVMDMGSTELFALLHSSNLHDYKRHNIGVKNHCEWFV